MFCLLFCRSSFLLLYKLSISVFSVLFLIVGLCVIFRIVSFDFIRISFICSIVGSLSFKESNLFYTSTLKGVVNFSNTVRSTLSGFVFGFSLVLFIFCVFLLFL